MVAILKSPYPHLRQMCLDDLEEISVIELSNYEYPWTHGIFRDCLRAGYACCVLTNEPEIVGYGIISVAASEAHVLNVSVARDQQGQGNGRRLMQRLIELARWHRAERIFLEVRPSNKHAICLYDDLGFNEIGKRPNYYPAKRGREDAVVMAMELLPPE